MNKEACGLKKVMRRAVSVAALLGGMALWSFGAAGAARAQEAGIKPLAVKVGAYLPSDMDARSASSDILLMVEAEYTIQNIVESNYFSQVQVGIGYTERDELRIIPVTLSQVFRNSNAAPGAGYYVGIGLGVYFTELNLPDTSGETKSLFGGFVVGGLDFGGSLFAEAKYHVISRYDRKNVDGLQLAVGVRF
jgi:hypothetical protein